MTLIPESHVMGPYYIVFVLLAFGFKTAKPQEPEASTLVPVSSQLNPDQNTDTTLDISDNNNRDDGSSLLAETSINSDDSTPSVPASPDASDPKAETLTAMENDLPNNSPAMATKPNPVQVESTEPLE